MRKLVLVVAILAASFMLSPAFAGVAFAQSSPCLGTPNPGQPDIPVLGAGRGVMCVPLPVAEAQAQAYRAYVKDGSIERAAIALAHACMGASTAMSECEFALASLKLQSNSRVEIVAVVKVADGEKESPRVPFPFVKAADPVGPTPGLAAVRVGQ